MNRVLFLPKIGQHSVCLLTLSARSLGPIWVGLCLARAFHGITGLTDGTVHEAVCQVYAGVTLQFVMAARENNQTHDACSTTRLITVHKRRIDLNKQHPCA